MDNKLFTRILCILLVCVMLTGCTDSSADPTGGTTDTTSGTTAGTTENSTSTETTGSGSSTDHTVDTSIPDDTTSSTEDSTASSETEETTSSTTSSNNGGSSNSGNSSNNQTQDTKIKYTVKVIDGSGKPLAGIIVKFSNGKLGATGADGVASISTEKGSYDVSFEDPKGTVYQYDAASAKVTASATSITVTLYGKAEPTLTISAYSSRKGDYTEYSAYEVGEGTVYAALTKRDMTYFVFVPSRSGVYSITVSCDQEVTMGYYGSTGYVLKDPAITANNGTLELEVFASNIGDGVRETTPYVIGIKLGKTEADCILTITRTGNAIFRPEDAQWQVAQAESKYLVPFTGTGELTNIDVLDPNTKVELRSDGYYYIAGTDIQVLVRLGTASPYMGSFKDLCDNTTFGYHVYKADGSFDYKIRYNELLYQYLEICNGDADGVVCPLNEQLAQIIRAYGDAKGWWNYGGENGVYLFGDKVVDPEIAWLFACCYYAP